MASLVALAGLTKRFGSVRAVADVSLGFEAGAIHAVVGENGAGKSTLLKMAAGVLVPDAGEVLVDGQRLRPHSAREAIRRGVGMVQQDFGLVGPLTVLENVMLGAEPAGAFGALDLGLARSRAEGEAREVGAVLPWDEPVERLGVGDRQRVAIVRAMSRDARVLILDEPTATATPAEVAALYTTLRRLAAGGKAVVVVTHHLREVIEHADTVSVMRGGRLVSTGPVTRDAGSADRLARDVMGGSAPPLDRRTRRPGEVRLRARDVRSGLALRGATFEVRAGEIVGLAGVAGSGQRELVRVIAGLEQPDAGEIRAEVVAVLHEDRHVDGLVLDASVRDNVVLGELARFTRLGLVDSAALDAEARDRVGRVGIAVADLDAPVRALSGGNQQRVVLVRALARAESASVLVLAEPTQGMDQLASRAAEREIVRAAEGGKAVLVVSADLAELRALCDRVLVMARGRVAADLAPGAPDADFAEAMLG